MVEDVTLAMATITMGLMAGVFGLYSHAIMPGLARTDDRTFIGAFQAIDRAIINAWFIPVFIGALVLTGATALLHLGGDGPSVVGWIAAAFVLYLAVVIITVAVNVPLNDAIKAAGEPDAIGDLGEVRRRFDQTRWVRWNLVRTVATTAAFVSLVVALMHD
jgi:uncharacterized membrane protein